MRLRTRRRRVHNARRARFAGTKIASRRRPIVWPNAILHVGDDSPVRRRAASAERRIDDARNTHAQYYAGREADILALWDSPRQREAYEWLARELPNLRMSFRWSAESGDMDTSATIAFYAGLVGIGSGLWEPVSWAEELIEPAQSADHRRLTQLYAVAAQCFASRPHR